MSSETQFSMIILAGGKSLRMGTDKADLILYVIDASSPLDKNDEEIFGIIQDKPSIILLNK